ncbi:MAG: hypothetical protein M3065_22145 [Actinomycetota bacterium]|nr:hypothetical protein [Actinomycetota bacterium]
MFEPVEVELARDPGAGARARRLVEDLAAGSLDVGELGRAKLLVPSSSTTRYSTERGPSS